MRGTAYEVLHVKCHYGFCPRNNQYSSSSYYECVQPRRKKGGCGDLQKSFGNAITFYCCLSFTVKLQNTFRHLTVFNQLKLLYLIRTQLIPLALHQLAHVKYHKFKRNVSTFRSHYFKAFLRKCLCCSPEGRQKKLRIWYWT